MNKILKSYQSLALLICALGLVSASSNSSVKKLSWSSSTYKEESYHLPGYFGGAPVCKNTPNMPCGPETLKYRTLDGTCNNVKYSWWGAAGTPLKRLISARYDDGVSAIRAKSVEPGYFLPNPTIIKSTLQLPAPTKSVWSNYFIIFGQTVAHEMVRTYLGPAKCDCKNPSTVNGECIGVSAQYDYEKKSSCYSFQRSKPSFLSYDCTYGPREQINTYTSYLDMSFIYGQIGAGQDPHSKAFLKTSKNAWGEESFPLRDNYGSSCPYQASKPIYKTADVNTEQNVYQTASQVIWLRNHNYIARKLKAYNKQWSDDLVFQEARRINIAQYQHVIYNEFLPNLLGVHTSKQFDLLPSTWGYYNGYNDYLYPQIYNEFASAAFRLHHLVAEKQCWATEHYKVEGCHPIGVGMLNSSQACSSLDYVTRGQLVTQSYYSRPQMSWTMNNWLLKSMDSIGVINIMRGRDHGLASYVHYREQCGLGRANNWDDLKEIPPAVREVLKKIYYKLADVELYVGGVAELPVADGLVGPTFSCIIAKQFAELKQGDRFYYENGKDQHSKFTLPQLDSIRGVSMLSVLCKNIRASSVAKWPFLYPDSKTNPFVFCNSVPDYDLKPWY